MNMKWNDSSRLRANLPSVATQQLWICNESNPSQGIMHPWNVYKWNCVQFIPWQQSNNERENGRNAFNSEFEKCAMIKADGNWTGIWMKLTKRIPKYWKNIWNYTKICLFVAHGEIKFYFMRFIYELIFAHTGDPRSTLYSIYAMLWKMTVHSNYRFYLSLYWSILLYFGRMKFYFTMYV